MQIVDINRTNKATKVGCLRDGISLSPGALLSIAASLRVMMRSRASHLVSSSQCRTLVATSHRSALMLMSFNTALPSPGPGSILFVHTLFVIAPCRVVG
jgi:hypothetical protein